jgi:DNA-binding NarL/FixJ family response regulator
MAKVLREAEIAPHFHNGAASGTYDLTARELEIIEKITIGLSNREVCEEFSISERTVKHHLTRIYNKIGVTNRLALALFAINNRLISSNSTEPNGYSNGAAHE